MAQMILDLAVQTALLMLAIAFILTVYRVIRGPTLPDRIVALDMLVAVAIGFIAVFAVKTGFNLYVDIAISLGLVGFLATVAFARFIMVRKTLGASSPAPVLQPAPQEKERGKRKPANPKKRKASGKAGK